MLPDIVRYILFVTAQSTTNYNKYMDESALAQPALLQLSPELDLLPRVHFHHYNQLIDIC